MAFPKRNVANLVSLAHVPEHFNPRCDATIPAYWSATVRFFDGFHWRTTPSQPYGDTAEEALANVKERWPGLIVPKNLKGGN